MKRNDRQENMERVSSRRPLLYWFLILSSTASLTSCNASSRTNSVLLDLSFKHFLETSRLEEAIVEAILDSPENLVVDVSNSILGDEKGFEGILKTLLSSLSPKNHDDDDATAARRLGTAATVGISFVSKHNRITPRAMDDFFQTLLSSAVNATTDAIIDAEGAGESSNKTSQGGADADKGNETATAGDAKPQSNYHNQHRPWSLNHLDVGWNSLQPKSAGWKGFLRSLQKLLQTPEVCPESIHFERCGLTPAACRAIGKGIINRYENADTKTVTKSLSLNLCLCGNPDLGDSGAAAIAAAIRTVVTADDDENNDAAAAAQPGGNKVALVLDSLDLSACEITDAGAEALALALESSPRMCIRHLNLSNNKISDVGAAAIAHALLSCGVQGNVGGPVLESLDLSGNNDIKDEAATVIAEAVGKGLIARIKLRSCHILADGATAFGKAVASLAQRASTPEKVEIDLSGNPLGVLRGKAKSGGKYSASAIKSKATATTAAYMSILQKGIKRGLKEAGVGDVLGNSGESDDEEEAKMGEEFMGDEDLDPSKARCGIKAFSNAILDENASEKSASSSFKCKLGLRRCFLDHGAADALAAVMVHSKEELRYDLSVDLDLNPVLEEEMIEAIQGSEEKEDLLREMSDRYLDALEAIRELKERAEEAARAAAARIRAERERESQWASPPDGFDDDWGHKDDHWREEEDDDEDEWDSDADYEEQEDDYY